MEDRLTLSQRQLKRWHLLRMVLEGRLSLREASYRMEISYRHAKRLKYVVARDGPRGLVDGNTGTRPGNAINLAVKQKIVELCRTQYGSFNETHFAENLVRVEGIQISRETVRKIRRGAGILHLRGHIAFA
jgi:transposase